MTEAVNREAWAEQLEAVNVAFARREAELQLQLQALTQQQAVDDVHAAALAAAQARITALQAELAACQSAPGAAASARESSRGKAPQRESVAGDADQAMQARDATLIQALQRASEDLHKLAAQGASERAALLAGQERAIAAVQAVAAVAQSEGVLRMRRAEEEASQARARLQDDAQQRNALLTSEISARNKLRLVLTELWTQRVAFIELQTAWLAELAPCDGLHSGTEVEAVQRAEQALAALRQWVNRAKPDFDAALEARDAVAATSTIALAELVSRDRLELQRAGLEVRAALQACLSAAQSAVDQAREARHHTLALLQEREGALRQLEANHAATCTELDRRHKAAKSAVAAELEALRTQHEAVLAAHADARTRARLARSRALLRARADRAERARQRRELQAEAAALREELTGLREQAGLLRSALDSSRTSAHSLQGLIGELNHRLEAAQGLLTEVGRLGPLRLPTGLRARIAEQLHRPQRATSAPSSPQVDINSNATMKSSPMNVTGAATKDLPALLALPGPEFVRACYRTLLAREPDPAGLAFYRARLREGVDKLQIVCELAASPEAKNNGRTLPGLAEALAEQKSRQRTLRGRIDRLIASAIQQGAQQRQQNRIEARLDEELHRMDRAIAALGDRLTRIEYGVADRSPSAPPAAPTAPAPTPPASVFSGVPVRTRQHGRAAGSPLERLDAAALGAGARR
jgi:hypothetical protein